MWFRKFICFFIGCFTLAFLNSACTFAEITGEYKIQNNYSVESSQNKLLIINSGDTIVFDFSQAICTPVYVQVPVFFLSDDDVYAVDFALRFNPNQFSYNSFINHKPYLNNSMSFNAADSTLRYSTFSMIPIDNNSPLISVRFNANGNMIGLNSFNAIQTWLNGDDCSFKAVNVAAAAPIIPGGITSINAGDSVSLAITVPSGYSRLWSTGSTDPSIWVYNAGVYSVAVTNPAGCTSSSYIMINANNPLPVELISFYGENTIEGIDLEWKTASELNSDYFVLEHSVDAVYWESIAEVEGAGTTNNLHTYSFLHDKPFTGRNYYRLIQYDFDGSGKASGVISITRKLNAGISELIVYPNPAGNDSELLNILLPAEYTSGTILVSDMNGKLILSCVFVSEGGNQNQQLIQLNLNHKLSAGNYIIRWVDSKSFAVTRLTIN